MSQYAQAALNAYQLVAHNSMSPRDAWEAAVAEVTESESARKKDAQGQRFSLWRIAVI